jgi:hypothetical protein
MYSNKHIGCVYYPIHKTSTTPLKKIQKTQIFSQMKKYNANEIYIQKLLKKIPNYSSFFYTFQTCETVNVGMMNQEDNIQQIDSDDSFVLLKYHRINYQSFTSFLDSTNKQLFDIYAYLLKSIQMLIQNNIVHSNICEKSIILNENNLPLLTMSQYSWCINDYDFNIKILDSRGYQPNVVIPFELFTIQYIIENKLTSISISNIYDICRHYKETLNLLVDIENGVLFLKLFINKPSATIITELFKFAKTWDNYSLSIVFLRVLQSTTTNPINKFKFIVDWINQLQTNINIDPRKRHSVETTYLNMIESRYHATVEDLR